MLMTTVGSFQAARGGQGRARRGLWGGTEVPVRSTRARGPAIRLGSQQPDHSACTGQSSAFLQQRGAAVRPSPSHVVPEPARRAARTREASPWAE
jgi:hypothetical protein